MSKILQKGDLPYSGREGDWVLAAGHRFVCPQWLCDSDQILDGDGGVRFEVYPEG